MRYKFLRFPDGKGKAVTFSYDDGCPEDVRLAETLNKYGIKCTFNLNSDKLRWSSGISKEDIEKHILSPGHEVAVHGELHRAEGSLRPIEGIRDVLNCRLELEEKFGRIIRGMAYPDSGITRFSNGATYEKIKNYLAELDIAYSRTLGGDNNLFELPTDWHAWMPTAHHINPKLMEYIDEFLNIDLTDMYLAARRPKLFYLWGHSYEFDRNNNWELLEEICQKLSCRDDIWYATNIEIYDYVQAYNSLVYSADGVMVYNPTLIEVWFDVDKKLYSVKPGETILLEG